MKNFFRSCSFIVIGMGLGIVLFIALIIFAAVVFSSDTSYVKPNSWLVLDFSGEISEKPPVKMPSLFSSRSSKMELYKYLRSIEYAATDKKIDGMIINADLTFYSKAHCEEIKNSIEKFKKSGKPVFAWFSSADNENYYLCLSADKIFMPDTKSAGLSLYGHTISIPYMKNTFDKIGLEFNVLHIGNYKGTGENYILDKMSKELKESYNNLITDLNSQTINEISRKRKINKNKITGMVETGGSFFMTPYTAKEAGFIDGIKNYGEISDPSDDRKNHKISINKYSKSIKQADKSDKIAVIYAEGIITNYFTGSDGVNGDIIGAKSFLEDIKGIEENDNIKAVVLRINSGGGSALASELMLQSLLELKKKKPVYVSLGPIAASGGYYISLSGEKIFALPSTLTGSIGVVSLLFNIESLSKKLGINFETVKKNKYDDFLSSYRKPDPEELNILYRSMKDIYDEFTGHVVKERKIKKELIPNIAEGRIWSGNQSKTINLSDEIGGLMESINFAADANKLKEYSIISYPDAPNFWDKLLDSGNVRINSELTENPRLKRLIELYQFYSKNGKKPGLILPFYELP